MALGVKGLPDLHVSLNLHTRPLVADRPSGFGCVELPESVLAIDATRRAGTRDRACSLFALIAAPRTELAPGHLDVDLVPHAHVEHPRPELHDIALAPLEERPQLGNETRVREPQSHHRQKLLVALGEHLSNMRFRRPISTAGRAEGALSHRLVEAPLPQLPTDIPSGCAPSRYVRRARSRSQDVPQVVDSSQPRDCQGFCPPLHRQANRLKLLRFHCPFGGGRRLVR
jgi:hypothetical protein